MTSVRLLELGLLRFGSFTDETLDFGGDSVLHIVFGPNEAGKSTALRAISALLFGVPVQTTDAYRHGMRDLRIGGRLAGAHGEELSFVRRKGSKNTLLGPDDAALPDSLLESLLGGVSQEVFLASYGLTHVSLRAGGDALLKGQGDVGETLFDAARGGQGVARVLEELREEADGLFHVRRPKCRIRQAVQAFHAAKKRRDEAALKPSLYTRQKADLEAARDESTRLAKLLRDLRVEHKRLEAVERAKPFVAERVELGLEREILRQGAVVSPITRGRREQAEGRLRDAVRECERTRGELERLERRLMALPAKESIGAVPAQVIEDVRQRLGIHHKAQQDLPKRQTEQRTLEETARRVELSLGRRESGVSGDPWLIDKPTQAKVQKLARDQVKIEQALKGAQRRLAEHAARSQTVQAELSSLGPSSVDPELGALVDRWERAHLLEKLAALAEEATRLETLLEEKGQALGLGSQQRRELARLPLPEVEAVETVHDEFEALARAEASLEQDLHEARSRAATIETDLGRLLGEGDAPTEVRLAEARQQRDGAFEELRQAYGERREAADLMELEFRYRRALTHSDDLSDRLRRESERVHRHADLVKEREVQRLRLEELALVRTRLAEQRAHFERGWQELWAPARITPKPPNVMRVAIKRLFELQKQAEQLALVKLDEAACRVEVANLDRSLQEALERSSVPTAGKSGEALALLAKRHLVLIQEATRRHEELVRIARDLAANEAAAEREVRDHEAEYAAWQRDWASALDAMGVPPETSPDAALAVLDGLGELGNSRKSILDLKRRVAGIERDAEAFAADVAELIRQHLPDQIGRPVADAAFELTQRYDLARRVDAEREHLEREKAERLHELAGSEEAARSAEAELEHLLFEARVSSLEELRQAEERGARAVAIEERLREIDQRLFEFRGESSLSALIEEVQKEDLAAVRLRLAEIDDEFPLVEAEQQAAGHRVGSLEAGLLQLDSDSGATEAAAEMEARLAELRTYTARYAELRLAILLLESELERYREQSQGPVLKRAGELFSRLTRGAYRTLRVDYDAKDVAVLGCVKANGERVEVANLSDGTRDQLYLALRLASLEVQAKQATTLPFILDDVFVHFDDERTEVALAVLGELSKELQIIVFTHHAGVVELGRRALAPGRLVVHELKGPGLL